MVSEWDWESQALEWCDWGDLHCTQLKWENKRGQVKGSRENSDVYIMSDLTIYVDISFLMEEMFWFLFFCQIRRMFQVYTNEVYEASAGHVEMHWLMKRPRFDAALPGARIMGRLALFYPSSSFCIFHVAYCIAFFVSWVAYYSGGRVWTDKTDFVVYTDYLCNRCMNQLVTWTQSHQGMRTRCAE